MKIRVSKGTSYRRERIISNLLATPMKAQVELAMAFCFRVILEILISPMASVSRPEKFFYLIIIP